MSSPKPFNWENLSANTVTEIRNQAKLLGLNLPANMKKNQMLNELLMAKTKLDQDNSFQQSTSATHSPNISKVPNIKQTSKTPDLTAKRPKKAQASQPANPTFISPLLLGEEEEKQEKSPVIKSSPKNKKTTSNTTNKLQLQPPPQQEAPQPVPERHSPSPRRSPTPVRSPTPEKHSPSPQRVPTPERNPTDSWSPTPEKRSPSPKRVPTPERNPSDSWSPSPKREHRSHKKSRRHSHVKYDNDGDSETQSTFYHYLPYILIVLFIASIACPYIAPIFVVLLIYYLYLRHKYNQQKSKQNILDF